jgi:hypothetical protein
MVVVVVAELAVVVKSATTTKTSVCSLPVMVESVEGMVVAVVAALVR